MRKTTDLLIVLILTTIVSYSATAADVNGYTSVYECRSGGPQCNVDVATLAAQACDQTIATGTGWGSINWSNTVICLDVGDHTAKGTLTLGASGTSGTRKVLRSVSTSNPWDVAIGSTARVHSINVSGDSYWIIDRVAVKDTSPTNHIYIHNSASNIIVSRVLSEGYSASGSGADSAVYIEGADGAVSNIVVQNSVIRSTVPITPGSSMCAQIASGTNIWFVNNEIYDCSFMIFAYQSGATVPGFVVENNDLYVSPAYRHTGDTRSYTEAILGAKADGTSANPIRWVQNRIWGMRKTAGCCDGGGSGGAVTIGGGAATTDYLLLQNNTVMDSHGGFQGVVITGADGTDNISVIGNIFYDIKSGSNTDTAALWWYQQDSATNQTHEVYLNTVIRSQTGYGWIQRGGLNNSDLRCNVVVDSDVITGSWGSGTQMDYNVYYGTTTSGESNVLSKSLSTLSGSFCTTLGCTSTANTTGLSIGDMVRPSSNPTTTCTGVSDTDCFLYEVQTVGASGTIKAIRGPFSFYRKLRTSAELVVIPYAIPHSSVPEATTPGCPITGESNATGSRTGIGIDNTVLGTGGFMDTGIKGARTQ